MANLFELAAKLTLDSSDYEKGIEAAKQAAANFAKGLTSVVTAVSTTDRAVNNAADSAENFGQTAETAANGVSDMSDAAESVTQAVQQSSNSMEDAADSAENLSSSADEAAESVENVEDSATSTSQKMGLLDRTVGTLADGLGALKQSGETVKKGFDTVHGAVDTVKAKFQGLTDGAKSLVDGGLSKVQSGIDNVRGKFFPLTSAAQNLIGVFSRTSDAAEENADAMEEGSKSADTLKNRIAMLQGVYDAAKAKVERLTDEFNKSAEETGATSDETKALARELDKAEREMNDAQKALDKYSDNADEAADATKKLGDEEDKTTKKTSVFKDTLKALLSRDAIKAGLGALWNGVKKISQAFISVGKQAVEAYGNYEQLAGGAKKIFEGIDYSKIDKDAKKAYKELNMSANEYLEAINLAGASFAQTMGSTKGYETARKGMIAIADYASGTGKNINELNQKYQMISRSASVYQSIADQFSGILPQTSKDFLAQAQSAGLLEKKYKKLTEVPVAEYQEAVTKMIEKGVGSLGLLGNTAKESMSTITGSLAMTKAAWQNLLVGISDDSADFDELIDNLVESASAAGENLIPRIEKIIGGIGKTVEKLLPILIERVPAMISENAPSILSSISSTATLIFNSLITYLPSIVSFGTKLIVNLVDGLIAALPQMVDAGVKIISELLTGLGSALPQILVKFVELIPQIVQALIDGIPELIQGAITFLTAIVDAIPEVVKAIAEALPQIVTSVVNGLIEAIPVLIDGAIQLLMAIVDAIPQILPPLIEALPQIIDALVNGLIEALPLLLDGSIKLFMALIDAIPLVIEMLVPQIPQIIEAIITALLDNIPKILEAGLQLMLQLAEGMISSLPHVLDAVLRIGSSIVEGLLSSIGSVFSSIGSWLNEHVFKPFVNGFKSLFGIHSPSTVMQTIGKFIVEGFINPIKELPGKVWNFLVSTVQKAIQFGTDMKNKAIEAARTFKDNIVNGLKSLPEKMGSIGKNVVTGLWNGIKDLKDWLVKKITGFGSDVVSWIKSALGIHSPSKYTAEDGKYLVQGLAKGILDNAAGAKKAAAKLSDDVLGAFNSDGLAMAVSDLPDLNTDISASLTASNATMNAESTTDKLLMMILEMLSQIDDGMKDKIKSAVDGMGVNWNDRELGRFVKSYA